MVRDLHSDLKTAKNALNNTEAWIVLFDIFVTDTQVLRLCNNEETITFASESYSPFPIGFESLEETSSGDLPYLGVFVSNVDRMVSGYLEDHKGLLDCKVVMKIIHTSNLSAGVLALETTLMIRETTVTDSAVNFRLSHHPFFEIDFPHQKYYRHRCRWQFKGTECGWLPATGGTGSSEVCDKSLDGSNGCSAHNNLTRFGGFPGIPKRRI